MRFISTDGSKIRNVGYIARVLHIAHQIALRTDRLVDRLLPPLLLIRHAVYDLFGHRMYPKHTRLDNMFQVAQALTAKLPLNP